MLRFTSRLISLTILIMMIIPFGQAQDELHDQKILLTFIPNIQFAPFYVGIEQGYFADNGLNISLEHLQEPEVVDLIAAEQAQFGVVSGEQIILASAGGREVIYVYEWFQQYPVGLIVASDTQIDSISDLSGMQVGVPGRFGATYAGLTTLLTSSEMSEADIQLQEIGFNAPEVVCVGGVDASMVYINNEPLQIRSRAEQGDCGDITEVQVIPVSDIADLVSNGIVTNLRTIEDKPELILQVTTAFEFALMETINNPARAYLDSLSYVENLPAEDAFIDALAAEADAQDEFLASNPDREAIAESRQTMLETLSVDFENDTLLQFQVLLASIDLWDADRLGETDLASWENMQDTLLTMGFLEDTVRLTALFTNDFLPTSDQ